MHHYPGLDFRKIRRMTLRQINNAIGDITFVNPWLSNEDGEKDRSRTKPAHPNGEIRLL